MPTKAAAQKTGYAAPPRPAKGEFKNTRVALVATRWNVEVVQALLAGARRCLAAWGVADKHVEEFLVPGAFELPLAVSRLMKTGRYDAVVTLGAVIRGDTPHFDFVAGECARGLREASQKQGVPLGFGVLTVNTAQQATERAGAGPANKGYEAVAAALEMVRLVRALDD
ncbi:MAG: 6,7-dimethyl-8-ribityllumazine synthase [Nevskia sp.]|nr:6,7-dimethyl-8-ribityllumazine synthase [Nevskia sp.]